MNKLTTKATADEVAAELEREGFAVVERLIDAERTAAIRAELRNVLDATPTGRNDFEGFSTRRIYALFAKTRAFDDLATHPLVLGVLDKVLGPSYQLSAPVGIEIGPGETAQNLHCDDGIYPVKRPHQELVLNIMWALDDFTEANGATHVVPGSHKWVDQRPEASTETVRAVMPAGSAMFFVGSVFHGGGANNTDKPRFGTIIEYCSGWLRPQ
ncbi:MAG: phytanoyl-CoA dioxygenase family protein, partial [Dehalococcoidia bacterium]